MSDREAFEKAYHKETGMYASWAPNNKGYTDVIAGMCYRIWQAAQAQAGDGVSVGWQYQHEDTGRTTFVSHAEASEFEELNSRRWHKTRQLYTAPPAAKIPEGWQIHAKVNAPADIKGQRIIGYRVTLPEGMFSEATDYLPSLTRPQPAVNQQLLESELTGEQWSAARKVFEQYANKLNSADKYEMASAYLDAAPQAIYAAIAAAQEQSK